MPALALADDFWLAAHDSKRPRTLGIGLAAALLSEMIFAGWVGANEGGLLAHRDTDRFPPPDDTALAALVTLLIKEIAAQSGRHRHDETAITLRLSTWIAYLQDGIAKQLVEQRLSTTTLVDRQPSLLWRPRQVNYTPADTTISGSAGARIKERIRRGTRLYNGDTRLEHDLVLAGIAIVTGIDRLILTDLTAGERKHLEKLIYTEVRPDIRHVIACAEDAITRLSKR